ncbi:MAG: SOS response-associated peptidase [Anaerolineae bacterium]|nr:SOS response-associated peptidase [Anaerolineae bacterium]NUQ02309.1 SOS response-associated peptidase [Anaerolineae bacterium]
MCGRYVLAVDPEMLQTAFNLSSAPDFPPRFNIAPTQQNPVISNESPASAALMRWGLIPSWAKDAKIGASLINARSESAAEKPSFRNALKRRRCLIPASGFYEWQQRDGGKAPMYIHLADAPVFAMAGLWEVWKDPASAEIIRTYSILTTEANPFMQSIHHRMPVILRPEDYAAWLATEEVSSDAVRHLMRPFDGGALAAHGVSKAVNRPANDSPDLIEPVA